MDYVADQNPKFVGLESLALQPAEIELAKRMADCFDGVPVKFLELNRGLDVESQEVVLG